MTLAKDVRALIDGCRGRRRALRGPWLNGEVPFVWQRHAVFEHSGLELARALNRPLVLSVHALQVREAASWGVRRPGWERAVERMGEKPALRAADLIAAGSEEVACELNDLGVPSQRVVVTPNEVDHTHFSFDPVGRERVRSRHDVTNTFVLGWVGSFRGFHGLDTALQAMAKIRQTRTDVTLMLVGDGVHRSRLEGLAQDLGLQEHVIFPGTVTYSDMPAYLSAMDATLMLAGDAQKFHYSPVKLREYMACSRPVIAHRTGQMARDLRDGTSGLLVEPGDPANVAFAALRVAHNPGLAYSLGQAARDGVVARGGWQRPVLSVVKALGLSTSPETLP